MSTDLAVSGMHCGSRARHVETAVGGLGASATVDAGRSAEVLLTR